MGTTDKRPSSVDTYPANQHVLDSYRQAEADLEQIRMPILLHKENPHERLYLAALDGTGNSMFDDKPEIWSVVARIHDQIERSKPHNIPSGYVEGFHPERGTSHTRAPH